MGDNSKTTYIWLWRELEQQNLGLLQDWFDRSSFEGVVYRTDLTQFQTWLNEQYQVDFEELIGYYGTTLEQFSLQQIGEGLAKYCIEMAWIGDGFPGELDSYIEDQRRQAGIKLIKPSIEGQKSPIQSETEANKISPSNTIFFIAKLNEIQSQIEERLIQREHRRTVDLVKRATLITPKSSQEEQLLSIMDSFVQQRALVNQNQYDVELQKYYDAKNSVNIPVSFEQEKWSRADEERHQAESAIEKMISQIEKQNAITNEEKLGAPLKGFVQESDEAKGDLAEVIFDFATELENERPQTPSLQPAFMTFNEFKSIIVKWYKDNFIKSSATIEANVERDGNQPSLEAKLKKTISEYEIIRNVKFDQGEDVSPLDVILKTLKTQLKNLRQDKPIEVQSNDNAFWETCKRSLHEAFAFYAKQQKMLGKKPCFEDIHRNHSILNIGKFVRFFRDFGLMEKSRNKQARVMDRTLLIQIFLKNSILRKEMEEEHFVSAVDQAADEYFNLQFDSLFETSHAEKPLEEKRRMFYKLLELDDIEATRKKFKGFGRPFGSNTDNRVPDNDIAKRYKYKEYSHQKMTVEEYKKLKMQPVRESLDQVNPPRIAPADAVVAFQKGMNFQAKKDAATKSRNPFTWQELGEMRPEQLKDADDDFDIKDLIVDDSSDEDDLISKQFPAPSQKSGVFLTDPPKPAQNPPKQADKQQRSLSDARSGNRLQQPKATGYSRIQANLRGDEPSSVVTKIQKRSKELEAQAKKADETTTGRAMKLLDNQDSRNKLMKGKFGKAQA